MLRILTFLAGVGGLSIPLAGLAQAAQPTPAGTHVEVSQEEISACGADVQRLCSSEFPDEAKVIACIRAKRERVIAISAQRTAKNVLNIHSRAYTAYSRDHNG